VNFTDGNLGKSVEIAGTAFAFPAEKALSPIPELFD
jgi:hypothetical protein